MSEIQVGQINSTDGSTAITTGADGYVSFAKTQIGGRRNLIINGAMQVAQRGTSATGKSSTGYFTADRMRMVLNTCGTYTFTQSSNAPNGFQKSFKLDTTTADASPTGGDAVLFETRLEGQDVAHLAHGTSDAKPVTLSFWVKSNKTGVGQVNFRNLDAGRMVSGTYTISVASTWEYKTITFPADTAGTGFDEDNNASVTIEWWLDGGSTYNTGATPSAWEALSQADRNVATTLNIADNTANEWQITGVQLEVGPLATPFEHRSYGEELALCQRYCYVWDAQFGANNYRKMTNGLFKSATRYDQIYPLPVRMRTNPSLTYSSASHFAVSDGSSSFVPSGVSQAGLEPDQIAMNWAVSGATQSRPGESSANNTTSAKFTVDAEL